MAARAGGQRRQRKGRSRLIAHANETVVSPDAREVMHDQAGIAAALARVRAAIAAACVGCGRSPDTVRLLPVTKTVPAERVRQAIAAGLREFGENKVQEARAKAEALADLPIAWSVIGHLQTNKARHVARFACEFQALDSLHVAEALDRRLAVERRQLDVFVQVNTSGEASKFGVPPADVAAFVRHLPVFSHLRVRGLMTLAVFSSDVARVRRCFALLRELRDRLRQSAPPGLSFDELSMGMSGDFTIAIEEGATIVRVGQAIFGPRPLPDSHYWPGAAGAGRNHAVEPVT